MSAWRVRPFRLDGALWGMTNVSARADGRSPLLVVVTGVPGTGKSTVAEVVAGFLDAAVLAHDWAMSALRPFPEIQQALASMEPAGHRVVGWSILTALARAQLRQGRSVVLDGVARAPELAQCGQTARDESARLVVVTTQCSDAAVHRSRVEGRARKIPNWYELDWSQVRTTQAGWQPLPGVDLTLEATDPWEHNLTLLRSFFA
jgi:predicted kinase